eukprot:1453967-Rhodomonas_salina.2
MPPGRSSRPALSYANCCAARRHGGRETGRGTGWCVGPLGGCSGRKLRKPFGEGAEGGSVERLIIWQKQPQVCEEWGFVDKVPDPAFKVLEGGEESKEGKRKEEHGKRCCKIFCRPRLAQPPRCVTRLQGGARCALRGVQYAWNTAMGG